MKPSLSHNTFLQTDIRTFGQPVGRKVSEGEERKAEREPTNTINHDHSFLPEKAKGNAHKALLSDQFLDTLFLFSGIRTFTLYGLGECPHDVISSKTLTASIIMTLPPSDWSWYWKELE